MTDEIDVVTKSNEGKGVTGKKVNINFFNFIFVHLFFYFHLVYNFEVKTF